MSTARLLLSPKFNGLSACSCDSESAEAGAKSTTRDVCRESCFHAVLRGTILCHDLPRLLATSALLGMLLDRLIPTTLAREAVSCSEALATWCGVVHLSPPKWTRLQASWGVLCCPRFSTI